MGVFPKRRMLAERSILNSKRLLCTRRRKQHSIDKFRPHEHHRKSRRVLSLPFLNACV